MDERDRALILFLAELLQEGLAIVGRGVELMPLDQLSQWEGVRAWQKKTATLLEKEEPTR